MSADKFIIVELFLKKLHVSGNFLQKFFLTNKFDKTLCLILVEFFNFPWPNQSNGVSIGCCW